MQINSVTNQSYVPPQRSEGFTKVKQAFQNLESALESGSLSDAKEALTQLQKFAPPRSDKSSDPMIEKMETLNKSLCFLFNQPG